MIAALFLLLLVLAAVAGMAAGGISNGKKLRRRVLDQFGRRPQEDYPLEDIPAYCQLDPAPAIDHTTWADLDMDLVFRRLNSCQSSVGEQVLYAQLHRLSPPGPLGGAPHPPGGPSPRAGGPVAGVGPAGEAPGRLQPAGIPLLPRWSVSFPWRPSTRCWPGCPWPVWCWCPSSPGWEAGCSWFLCAGTWPCTTWVSAGPGGPWTPWGPSSPCSPPAGGWKAPSPSPPSGRSCAPPSPPSAPCWAGCRGQGSPAGRTGSCAGSTSGCSPLGTCGCTARPKSSWPPIPQQLRSLFEAVGAVDMAVAVLSFRATLPQWCRPVFWEENAYDFTGLFHPLLQEPVANSGRFTKDVLLTGSNASGSPPSSKPWRSTPSWDRAFSPAPRRAAASGRGRCSPPWRSKTTSPPGRATSWRRCAPLSALPTPPGWGAALLFIDEILRGTNTGERLAASQAVLEELHRRDCLCVAATHDRELTWRRAGAYRNYHFPGDPDRRKASSSTTPCGTAPANTQNAIRLLGLLGFPQATVRRAEELAEQGEERA